MSAPVIRWNETAGFDSDSGDPIVVTREGRVLTACHHDKKTFLVMLCTDGYVREVAIKDIVPV